MGLNLRKTFCVTLYITYMLIISQNCFGQFISNHFELENDVKMTPKRLCSYPRYSLLVSLHCYFYWKTKQGPLQ